MSLWWDFGKGLLIGLGVGIPIGLFFFFAYNYLKKAIELRKVAKLLKEGKFLKPFDKKDYDVETWKDYIQPNDERVKDLDKDIFKREEKEKNGQQSTTIEQPTITN